MSAFREQVIHSGHFMTSNLHNDVIPEDDDEDIEVDVVEDDDKSEEAGSSHKKQKLDEKPVTFYKFGPTKTQSIAIDVSLNKLNKCIQVAYNKMTTPKWKDFKGLRLHWKQRIRLNNVIWRAYYIEFRKNKPAKPIKPFCYFAVPDDDTTHQKIEGSVMEGMYWKRRMEAVCAQYKRWRIRSRNSHHPGMIHNFSSSSLLNGDATMATRRAKKRQLKSVAAISDPPPVKLTRSMTPKHCVSEEWALDFDDLNNVFTDELFDSLSQPYAFPNPKETWQTSNADIMQPGLLPLQPTIEDIMASFGDDFPEVPEPSPQQQQQQQQTPASTPMRRSASSSKDLHQMTAPVQVTQPHIILPPERPIPATTASSQQQQQQQQRRHHNNNDFVAAASMLDYSRLTMMPTRQSSAITSQMLMLSHTASVSTAPPSYATSSHYTSTPSFMHQQQQHQQQHQQLWKTTQQHSHMSGQFVATLPPTAATTATTQSNRPPIATTSNDQYMPQFLQSPQPNSLHDQMMAPSRSWWMDSPLTASVQSPLSIATPLPLANVGPQTPLGQLMGGNTSTPPPPPQSNFHSVDQRVLKIGGTLTQRLEQPPITAAPLLETKSFTSLTTPAQQQHQQQIDFSSIARIRTSSMCSSGDWKSPYQSSPSSASASVSATSASATTTTTPPNLHRQTSCDPALLVQQQHSEEKPTRLDPIPKEEPALMSAPSSVKLMRRQVPDSTMHPEERKRILHLHAEQSRRMALKDGFDQLMDILPDLRSGGVKPTNAVVLAKAAEHIRRLQKEKWEKAERKAEAKAKIEKLNQRIAALQSNLPASSSSGSGSGSGGPMDSKAALESFFERYSREESKKDWRFWVLSQMLQPICVGQKNSYAACVAGESSSRQEIAATCSDWLNEHWKVTELRPLASSLLVRLATNSNIITDGGASVQEFVNQQLKTPF